VRKSKDEQILLEPNSPILADFTSARFSGAAHFNSAKFSEGVLHAAIDVTLNFFPIHKKPPDTNNSLMM
jgi:hypothetical protein